MDDARPPENALDDEDINCGTRIASIALNRYVSGTAAAPRPTLLDWVAMC
jgi:hypothetical protein